MSDDTRRERTTAVALRYRHGEDPAPRVTAAGRGDVADRILEIARRKGIPLREDPDLVQALSVLDLDLDQMIPPELYGVIAEVMAWAYRANGRYRIGAGGEPGAGAGEAGAR